MFIFEEDWLAGWLVGWWVINLWRGYLYDLLIWKLYGHTYLSNYLSICYSEAAPNSIDHNEVAAAARQKSGFH